VVGRGGMSVVYRAEDRRLSRPVALKLLASELAEDPGFRERFLREARIASSIEHPAVVPVYDAGAVDGQLYIAMRYVEGSDLRRVLQAEGRLEPRRALRLCADVADALDVAHERGLVHRDVKPSNVLIAVQRGKEHYYLADFGLTQSASGARATAASTHLLGTPDYVAPEQIRGEHVDGRADVYALGCLLYECLTGQPPFQRGSEIAVVYAHLEEPPPAPSAQRPELGEEIDAVIATALAKSPDDRQATCSELVEAASAALLPRLSRRRRALRAALLAAPLPLIGAVLLVFFLARGGEAPEAAAGMVVRIDAATNRPLETIPLRDRVSAIAGGTSAVWAASFHDAALWRTNPVTGAATRVAPVGAPRDVAVYGSRAYVVSQGSKLGADNLTVYGAATGNRIDGFELIGYAVAAGRDGVWTAGWLDVKRVGSAGSLRIAASVPIPGRRPLDAADERSQLSRLALGAGSLWVLGDAADRRIWRIDPRSGRIVRVIELRFTPADLAVGAGSVWVSDQIGDTVTRIDAASGRVAAVTRVARGAAGIAFGGGSVWVTSFLDGVVSRIDPRTSRVVATIPVGGSPRDVTVAAGSVWVAGTTS
jgi:YVTN family beta-propeller protein